MRCGERSVKWLDAERRRVAREAIGVHQSDRSEPSNIAVVKGSAIVENELDGRVLTLTFGQIARVDQQRTGETRLHNQMIAAGEIENDQLRASPRPSDSHADEPLCQRARADLAQDVRTAYVNGDDGSSCALAIEVAGDGLGFRKLRHP